MSNSTYRSSYGNYCGAEVQNLHGLYNQGSTCYLNSVLQVLFRTEDFREAVESHYHENTAGGNCLDCRLQSLFKELKWRTGRTHSITKCLGIDRVYEQQNAAEYFEKILSLTSPHVSQVFRGLLTDRTICSSCGTEMDFDGPFWYLPLALGDSDSELYSMVSGIEDYFRESSLTGENQLYCDSCHAKSDGVTKRVTKNHPEVLMLLLKRFTFDYMYMQYIKINSDVIIPDTLQIPENQTYELYAVVDHFGSLRGGHYTATINVNGEWYTFNDSSVTKTQTRSRNIISSSAYLLFYKKTKGCDVSSSGVSLEPSTSSEQLTEISISGPSLNPTAEDERLSTDPADRRPPRTGMISKIVDVMRYLVGASSDSVKEEPCNSSTGQDLTSASSDKKASSGVVSTPQDEVPPESSTAPKSSQNSPPTCDTEDKHCDGSTSKQDETSVRTAANGTHNIREVSTTGNFPTPKTGICVTDDRNDSSPQDTDCRRRDDVKQIFIHQKEERRRAVGAKRDKEGKTEGCREMTPDIRIMLQEAQRHSSGHSEQKESSTQAHGKEKSSGKTRLTKYDICFPKPGTDSNITDNTMINHQTCRQRPRSRFESYEEKKEEKKDVPEASEQRRGHEKRSQSKERLERQHQYEGHMNNQNNGGSDDSREEKSEQTVSATHKKHRDVDEEIKTEVRRRTSSLRRTEAAGSRRVNPLKLQKIEVTTAQHKHKDKRQTSTVKAQDVSPNVPEMTGSFSNPHATRGRTGKVSQSGRVLHGLYNQGATCYLNCVLQVLFMTKEIHDRLTETQTDRVLKELFNDLQNKTCGTETITRCLSFYDVFKQCDAANCLKQILHHISEGASEVFQGQLSCITRCCQKHSIHEESKKFWIFPLSLKHGPDRTYCVEESFQDFFKPETFTGNNKLFCDTCGNKTAAETRREMSKYPDILTVLLKAFDFDVRFDVKSKCSVKVPHSLELENKTYELYGVVDHTGSLRGGHYTATILSSEDNTWYQLNDAHVSKVHEQPFDKQGYYNSQSAYLLMYRVSQSGRVLHGLYNQGSTCYLNCVLQVLFMTKEIHDRLTETETDRALKELFNDLRNKTCGTETITHCLSISDVKEQRDAAHCLMQILCDISKEASEVFQGRMRCITTCCQKHSIHRETKRFWIFPLSLKHGPDRTYCVEKSFQRFFQPEAFTGNNNLFCIKCGNKTAAETRLSAKYPDILTVLLKRFDIDVRSDVKSKCPVKVPRSLKLENKTYELYGIVDHTGSLRGGHYTATILSSEDNTWYQFNDAHVSKVPEQPFAQEEYYNSQNAYLLMYSALRSRRNTAALCSNVGQIQQVIVFTPKGEKMIIDLCNTEEEMQKMTVLQLKEKIIEEIPEYSEDMLQVVFERVLEDDEILGSCEIQHMSTIHTFIKLPGGGGFPSPPRPPPRPPRRRSIELFMSF